MQTGGDSDATATGLYVQADLPPGTLLAERFRIEKMLGIGGMGVVYRATDIALCVPVALKLLRPELMHRSDAIERFRQELLLARQVSNPHVVRIHDLAQHEGRWLLTMDYVDGESLDRRLDREGRFPVEDALRIARQLAEGLAAAHAKGVVHRDLKPANVLLDAQGDAYISDFGVARSLAAGGMTRSGTVVGTPDYLSPEQARGEAVDARSDLYSLGLILYEMLTGKLPFAGGTMSEVLAQRMLRAPEPVERGRGDLPAWVARLVDRMLRPQPAHRFQSASDIIQAIDRREVPRQFRRDQWLRAGAWGAGIATVLVVAGGAWWWNGHRQAANGVAALKPLDRVLVLPIAHDAALPATQAAALTAHLREALAATPGVAIVDGERTDQALRQLDAAGTDPDPATLRSIAAARDVLRLQVSSKDGRWRVESALTGNGDARWASPDAGDAPGALRAWLALPRTRQALHATAAPRLQLPASTPALQAQGAGLLAMREGKLPEALQRFQEATKAAPDDASAWLSQADAAQGIGEQDVAWDALERGLQASGGNSRVHRKLVAAHALLEGDAPSAVAQWRALLAATPDDTEAELNLARAQGAGGDFNAAIVGLQKLTARDGNDPRAWFELGKFSILQGQARRAVDEYLVRALVQFKRGRNLYGVAETVNALGVGYGRLGQNADAAEQYSKAVDLRRALGNRRGVATSLRNLANVLSVTGHFDEAAQRLGEARALNATLGDRSGLAAVDNELGLLAEERGDYRTALDAFRRALQSWRQAEDAHGTADALNNIGFANFQLGNYDDAQAYWQQSADAYDALGEDTGRIRVQQNLGLLATARGRWREARRLLTQSLARAEKLQMPEEAAVSRRNLAELELLQGHVGAAIAQATQANTLFRARDDLRGQSDVGLLHVQALLAAHADADAAALLKTLAPALKEASVEQRAIAELARAEIASRAGRKDEAAAALREATKLASTSGARQLQLEATLQHTRPGPHDATLDAATAALGNATLRLEWLEQAMRDALLRKDFASATKRYREAALLLRAGDALRAVDIHALGARALAASDAVAARTALAKAADARDIFRNALPPALRSRYDATDNTEAPIAMEGHR
jgi:eukaryotic-like serine/threonine-protein kinase